MLGENCLTTGLTLGSEIIYSEEPVPRGAVPEDPGLQNLSEPAAGPPPPFEDMVERVRQATVLIEGFR